MNRQRSCGSLTTKFRDSFPTFSTIFGGAENAGVENARVENAGAITYGKQ